MKRHTCVICKKKRYTGFMKKAFSHSWVCANGICENHKDIVAIKKIIKLYRDLEKVTKVHIFGK